MAIQGSLLQWLKLITFACTLLAVSSRGAASDDRKVHIVYMGDLPKGEFSAVTLHNIMLEQVLGSGASELLLHSYRRSFNGFAAKLTNEEAEKLTWKGLFLFSKAKRRSSTRDLAESESFDDKEFGPPLKQWKGSCQKSSNFTCNKKIIGARYYRAKGDYPLEDLQSLRDSIGHGRHTASIAAGAVISKASLYGFRTGTVRRGVPSAHIAVYKICRYDGCYDEDILAAFNNAIVDGVDIISLSAGGFFASEYFNDSIATGAFHSMKNGILTSNSAGNDGPYYASDVYISPCSFSVGASTIDKKFQTMVKLGTGEVFKGTSVNTFDLKGKFYPPIWGVDAPKYSSSESRVCLPGSLNETVVKGKIVLCDYLDFMEGPLQAGAVGALIRDDGFKDFAYTFVLPVSVLVLTDGSDILHYINTTKYQHYNFMISIINY